MGTIPLEEVTDSLIQSLEDIWTDFLEMDLQILDPPPDTPPDSDSVYTSLIEFQGEWNGAVVLQCSHEFAGVIAGGLCGLDPSDLGPAEVADAIGELANIVAGNMAPTIPGEGTTFTLPKVIDGAQFEDALSLSSPHPLAKLSFQCQGHTLTAHLFEPSA